MIDINKSEQDAEFSRLQWRCRRGMLELDLLLQAFLNQEFKSLNDEQREGFFRLLDYPDQELLETLMLQQPTEDKILNDVIAKIRSAI